MIFIHNLCFISEMPHALQTHSMHPSSCVIFFTVLLLGGNYSLKSIWGFSMTTCSPRGSLNLTIHHRHIIPTRFPFNSHFPFLLFPSHFLGLALHLHLCHITSCSLHLSTRWQSEEPIFTKLLLVLPFHSLSCLTCCRAKAWDCSLSSPKK